MTQPKTVHSFEKIYTNESGNILRFCLNRVSLRDQALDITQETFMRLWRSMRENKIILNDKAFLFTVAKNLITDWYRKKKSLPLDEKLSQRLESEKEHISAHISPRNFEIEAEARYLVEKIKTMKEQYRYPLYLKLVKDFSPSQIGKILGISANAASVKVSRALKELRTKIGNQKN
jgi:RNA polymerase sigma-70 factor (ECF subfamily)